MVNQSCFDDVPFGPTGQDLNDERKPLVVGLIVIACLVAVGVAVAFFGCHQAPSVTVATNERNEINEVQTPSSLVFVHVVGAVVNPGVYEVPEGSRLADVIDVAGGFSEDASIESLNLARTVTDGEQIRVYSVEEVEERSAGQGAGSGQRSSGVDPSGKVNINLATVDELQTVSGIGEVTAKRIVADREAHGPFASVDDLSRVSGIGEKTVAKMRDSLTV